MTNYNSVRYGATMDVKFIFKTGYTHEYKDMVLGIECNTEQKGMVRLKMAHGQPDVYEEIDNLRNIEISRYKFTPTIQLSISTEE